MTEGMKKSRVGCAFVHLADQPDWAEAFLLSLGGASTSSAPCSATGTLRRDARADQEPQRNGFPLFARNTRRMIDAARRSCVVTVTP